MIWKPNEAEFRIFEGNYFEVTPPASALIHEWTKSGGVPEPGNETIRFNFWLFNGDAPTNGLGNEVVISDFGWQENYPE